MHSLLAIHEGMKDAYLPLYICIDSTGLDPMHSKSKSFAVSVFQSPTMLQLIDIKGQGKDNLDDRMIKQETNFDL